MRSENVFDIFRSNSLKKSPLNGVTYLEVELIQLYLVCLFINSLITVIIICTDMSPGIKNTRFPFNCDSYHLSIAFFPGNRSMLIK